MVIFLTSSFVEYQKVTEYIPKPLNPANDFAYNLKKYWKPNSHFLIFASDPKNDALNDYVLEEMQSAFRLAKFSLAEIKCFDHRYIEQYQKAFGGLAESCYEDALKEALSWADVFYLAGGHAPTENAFMKACNLKKWLTDSSLFDGIFLGLSAGAVNAAHTVYLIPELPGESIDPSFIRFTDGLGLTNLNIVPHIDYEETVILDGQKLIDEIVATDNFNREIYLIPDGSYFMIHNGVTEFFGEGSILKDGKKYPLHSGIIHDLEKSDSLLPSLTNGNLGTDTHSNRISFLNLFDSLVSDYYDCVFELDPETEQIKIHFISSFLLEHKLYPVNIKSFMDFNNMLSESLVVLEEKAPFIEQIQLSVVTNEIAQKGSYVRTVHFNSESGIRAESVRINPINESTKKLLVCLTDISMILDHDWMTDEYSRSGFITHTEQLLKSPEYQTNHSIVYTNIHGFKAINDLLGTFSGDMVIFMERDLLVRTLKPVLIARLESDHFALVVHNSYLTDEILMDMCSQYYEEKYKRLPLQLQCGIYQITDPSKTVQFMLDRAKLAENSISSDHGISYAICDDKLSNDYVTQRFLISEIDAALSENQFQTYYQPVVDAKTEQIVSAEALIRWVHPQRGMISPGQFIPVFEKEGVITRLDYFMIKQVLEFNQSCLAMGMPTVPCAVNLSRVDFYDMKLLKLIKEHLSKHKNIQDLLKLEVTESAYAVLESDAIAFLNEMKELGLSLLLDDFGSGMSSLSTIQKFEFDVIKLDMGFISQIGKSQKAEAIIKHTIGLSHDVGAKVVAEGVETKEQLEFLRAVDCDMIQGYYFYKPMPQKAFFELLQSTHTK